MGFIRNFKYLNNREGIASTWGTVGADYIKSLESRLVSCKLDMDNHYKKVNATVDKSDALQATGVAFDDDQIVNLHDIILSEQYKLYISRVSYYYACKLLESLDNLTNATLEGLSYREARKRFKEYKNEINLTLAHDNMVGMYIDAINKIGYSHCIAYGGDLDYEELDEDDFQNMKDEILTLVKKSFENNKITYNASELDYIIKAYPLIGYSKSQEYYSKLMPTLASE